MQDSMRKTRKTSFRHDRVITADYIRTSDRLVNSPRLMWQMLVGAMAICHEDDNAFHRNVIFYLLLALAMA